MVQIGEEQIHPSVLIEVGGIHTHAGACLACFAISDTRREADLLEALAMVVLE